MWQKACLHTQKGAQRHHSWQGHPNNPVRAMSPLSGPLDCPRRPPTLWVGGHSCWRVTCSSSWGHFPYWGTSLSVVMMYHAGYRARGFCDYTGLTMECFWEKPEVGEGKDLNLLERNKCNKTDEWMKRAVLRVKCCGSGSATHQTECLSPAAGGIHLIFMYL